MLSGWRVVALFVDRDAAVDALVEGGHESA